MAEHLPCRLQIGTPTDLKRPGESRQDTKMGDRAGNLGMVCWRHRRDLGLKRVVWGVEMEL